MRIREVIKENGFTTQDVAIQMGITVSSLNQSISGNPSVKLLRRISDIIGCSLVDFFTDESENNMVTTAYCPKCGAKLEFRLELEY